MTAPQPAAVRTPTTIDPPLTAILSPVLDCGTCAPLPLKHRLSVHNLVVHRIRRFLQEAGFIEIPVPGLTTATGSCEEAESIFSLDYFGALAFPRQTAQLYLEELVVRGFDAVYCEGESLRRVATVDRHHLTGFKLIEVETRNLDLDGLCELQEKVLKDAACSLHADRIGGRSMTRIDRMLGREHPRMTYREAVAVLNRRGFTLQFGDDLAMEAEASLIRYCGNIPLHVTHYPASLKFFNLKLDRSDPSVVECVDTILPYAGETFGGGVREHDPVILRDRLFASSTYAHLLNQAHNVARQRCSAAVGVAGARREQELAARYIADIRRSFEKYLAVFDGKSTPSSGFGLGIARLLQYFMGLNSIKDAVIFPMDRNGLGTVGH